MANEKRKTIYDSLELKVFSDDIYSYRDKAKQSLCFSLMPKNSKGRKDYLVNLFQLDENAFDQKYDQAATGSGNAWKDFDAIKSSALIALLCFYNVEKKHIRIEDVTYDKSFFEVKNTVINTPSNMDVVLTGIDENNKSVILFLECKFSEYLKNDVEHISAEYFEEKRLSKKLYDLLQANELGKYCTVDGKSYCFYTPDAYSQGIKQIISHLVGLESFLKRDDEYGEKLYPSKKKAFRRREIYSGQYDRVIFRELLFKFGGYEEELKRYVGLSEKVKELFINKNKMISEKIEFKSPLEYKKDIFSKNIDALDKRVKSFYKF